MSRQFRDVASEPMPSPFLSDRWRLLGLPAATRGRWAGAKRHVEDALGIRLRTVATHVRNILSSKTGSANRTEAAAYALGQGLVEG
jgi:hypothetical protein